MPELSVVIPVRDEADNVAPLVRELVSVLQGGPAHELVFVDDGSVDGTVTALRAVRAELGLGARLRILRHHTSCGQSTALWGGVHAAHGALIVTLDGDGQNDPADIPRLLAGLEGGTRGLVIGHRVRRDDGWVKRAASRVANAVRGWLLGDGTPDTGCGLKAFPRALFLELPYFDHMHRFLPALVRRAGGSVLSLPVNHRPRARGRSKYGVWDRLWVGLVDLAGVAWLTARERRQGAVEETDSGPP